MELQSEDVNNYFQYPRMSCFLFDDEYIHVVEALEVFTERLAKREKVEIEQKRKTTRMQMANLLVEYNLNGKIAIPNFISDNLKDYNKNNVYDILFSGKKIEIKTSNIDRWYSFKADNMAHYRSKSTEIDYLLVVSDYHEKVLDNGVLLTCNLRLFVDSPRFNDFVKPSEYPNKYQDTYFHIPNAVRAGAAIKF